MISLPLFGVKDKSKPTKNSSTFHCKAHTDTHTHTDKTTLFLTQLTWLCRQILYVVCCSFVSLLLFVPEVAHTPGAARSFPQLLWGYEHETRVARCWIATLKCSLVAQATSDKETRGFYCKRRKILTWWGANLQPAQLTLSHFPSQRKPSKTKSQQSFSSTVQETSLQKKTDF